VAIRFPWAEGPNQIEAQRSGFDLERRRSGGSEAPHLCGAERSVTCADDARDGFAPKAVGLRLLATLAFPPTRDTNRNALAFLCRLYPSLRSKLAARDGSTPNIILSSRRKTPRKEPRRQKNFLLLWFLSHQGGEKVKNTVKITLQKV